ncbi:MAG: DNA internalization-related competence protein ComEC/Rec2 [Armatimonadota bacterium]
MLPLSSAWLYRRPLFWCALASVAAAFAAIDAERPPLVWLGAAALVSSGLLVRPARPFAAVLAVALCFGAAAALRLQAPPGLPVPGTPLTVRGTVARVFPAREQSRPVLLQSEARRTPAGWAPDTAVYGMRAPADARPGDRVEVSGVVRRPPPATNPGGSSPRLTWLRRGAHRTLAVRPEGYRKLAAGAGSPLTQLAERARAWVLESNRRTLPPRAALIVNSFLIGESASPAPEVEQEVKAAFRESGTLHLLVVSGAQVMLVLGFFIGLGRRLWRFRGLCWTAGLLALGFYYLLTGGDSSITRAAVMGGIYVAALAVRREPDGENCLGAAGLALLALDPLLVLDIGAQLSFTAVWALVRVAGPLGRALGPAPAAPGAHDRFARHLHQSLAAGVATCLAAFLGTAPVLAYHFHRVTWIAPLANVGAALLSGFLMLSALLHLGLSALGLYFWAPLLAWQAEGLYHWASLFAGAGGETAFPAPVWLIPPLLVGMALPTLAPPGRLRLIAALGSVALLLAISTAAPSPPPSAPTLRALDVGQGDSLLLQGPDGTAVLVDAGPEAAGPAVVRALRSLRVPALDAVVVSHAHDDHVGGLPEVLAEYRVGLLAHALPETAGRAGDPAQAWAEAHRVARERGVPVRRLAAGDRLRIRGSTLAVLGPLGAARTDNEASLVFRWDIAGARFLLTGDMEADAERALLRWREGLRADVLKVAHHGSDTSSTAAFLQAVRPRQAVLSCGRDNRVGHPKPIVLQRLEAAGIPVARTDQGGMVTVRVEPGSVRTEPFLPGGL